MSWPSCETKVTNLKNFSLQKLRLKENSNKLDFQTLAIKSSLWHFHVEVLFILGFREYSNRFDKPEEVRWNLKHSQCLASFKNNLAISKSDIKMCVRHTQVMQTSNWWEYWKYIETGIEKLVFVLWVFPLVIPKLGTWKTFLFENYVLNKIVRNSISKH